MLLQLAAGNRLRADTAALNMTYTASVAAVEIDTPIASHGSTCATVVLLFQVPSVAILKRPNGSSSVLFCPAPKDTIAHLKLALALPPFPPQPSRPQRVPPLRQPLHRPRTL